MIHTYIHENHIHTYTGAADASFLKKDIATAGKILALTMLAPYVGIFCLGSKFMPCPPFCPQVYISLRVWFILVTYLGPML
jgi:hypothetical protein